MRRPQEPGGEVKEVLSVIAMVIIGHIWYAGQWCWRRFWRP